MTRTPRTPVRTGPTGRRRRSALRAATATLTATVTATAALTAVAAGTAQAAPDPTAVRYGAQWLTGELTGGLVRNEQFDVTDYGLSIDVALALDAVGGRDGTVQQVTDAVRADVGEYIAYTDPQSGTTSRYAGATAKTMTLALAAGREPRSFGGVNLNARLGSLTSTEPTIDGRIFDTTGGQPDYQYANTVGQAFAAGALAAGGSPRANDAIDFLLQQQCAEGYFRLTFAAPDAADQSCDAGRATGDSPADTDATALAVIQLAPQAATRQRVAAALERAETWLLGRQRDDGSYGGGTSTEAPNTNSTGLAGWALAELGRPGAAGAAATWVRRFQAGDTRPCQTGLTPEHGAVAYNGSARDTARQRGITAAVSDQFRRASAQALPALAYARGAFGQYRITGPTTAVRPGSRQTLRVSGLAPYELGCFVAPNGGRVRLTGTGRVLSRTVQVPNRRGDVTWTVTSLQGSRRFTLRVR